MSKKNIYYECSNCSYRSASKLGKCPGCSEFGTLEELIEEKETDINSNRITSKSIKAEKLKDVKIIGENVILKTGINEFDRVVGSGIVSDSVNVISAPPGAGKTTLLFEVSNNLAKQGKVILYISGEESSSQLKIRAERILDDISENIYIKSETNLEKIIKMVKDLKPELLIIDSIQMVYSDNCDGTIGGSKQLLHCSYSILNTAKSSKDKMAVFFVGQMTKADELRGVREFEHMVDGVFSLSVEDDMGVLRMFKSSKNRFGDISEVGLFEMIESGLKEITNPSKYFITERVSPVSGSCISAIQEGSRTIAIEINALSENNNFSFPSRISQGINKDFLQIILAIMDNKLNTTLNLKKKDIYIQTSNGLKIKGTSVGLALAFSIYSSILNIPISEKVAFLGEVSLTGEIKKVPNIDRLISDFERMGFEKMVIPKNNTLKKYKNIEIIEISNIKEIIKLIEKL